MVPGIGVWSKSVADIIAGVAFGDLLVAKAAWIGVNYGGPVGAQLCGNVSDSRIVWRTRGPDSS